MKTTQQRLLAMALLAANVAGAQLASAQDDTAYHPHIGQFVSVKPTAQTQTIVLPPTHTFQLLAKSGLTAYTAGGGTMPGNNDFTAYVPINGSSRNGYLSINHENNPGGVSIMDLNLTKSNMLWNTSQVRKVDFTGVVQTERNCSGGITPWGTVITSEESTPTIDANLDGYQDRGWQVEIDPVTAKIRDYKNDGIPDKLWAHGRMNHENIAIGSDSVTTYQAEDGGTNCVYKFVATTKGDLTVGNLYVLKRDASNPVLGSWIQVPNSTQADRNNARTIAQSLGGTSWNGPEDIEFGPDGLMYFTSKGTGTIWRFKDNGSTVSAIEAWVTNKAYTITHAEGTSSENWGTGIDNLVFDGDGNLWAQQDGGRNHLWVIRPDHTPANPKVALFATLPAGAEPTGLTFSPDYRYGFLSIQHPNSGNTLVVKDAADSNVRFNAASTIVFARNEFLGVNAIEPEFELGAKRIICKYDSALLTAYTGSDATVKWTSTAFSDTLTGATLTAKQEGMYYATAYGSNGRRYTDSVYVQVDELLIDLGYNIPLCNTCSITLDAGSGFSSYLWNNHATTQTITVTNPGTYAVAATSVHGCIEKDTVAVIQKNGNGNTLVPSQMITIYPNPFQTSATIKIAMPQQANVVLEVRNTTGTLIAMLQNGSLNTGDHYFTFTPATTSTNGIYLVKLKVNHQQATKMIKQQ